MSKIFVLNERRAAIRQEALRAHFPSGSTPHFISAYSTHVSMVRIFDCQGHRGLSAFPALGELRIHLTLSFGMLLALPLSPIDPVIHIVSAPVASALAIVHSHAGELPELRPRCDI